MAQQTSQPPLLWLPSWYPSKIDPFAGDFIQRHAIATSMFRPVQVIFIVKDEYGRYTKDLLVEEHANGRLHETIVYYHSPKTGMPFLDRMLSARKYLHVGKELLRKYIRQAGRPAAAHVHVALRAGHLAIWLKKKYQVPYIVTEHWTGYQPGVPDNLSTRSWLFRRSSRMVFRYCAKTEPVSRQLGKLLNGYYGPLETVVIPNTVNTRSFYFSPEAVLPFTFIHVSLMNAQKNCEGILRAFASLAKLIPGIKLRMVGPAPSSLLSVAAGLGIADKLEWLGEISYDRVAIALRRASAMVMFSQFENLPCAILEALCCGIPVIATDVGGISEVISSENGILVEAADEEALSGAMKTLYERYGEYNRKAIAEKAQSLFGYETVGQQIARSYGSL